MSIYKYWIQLLLNTLHFHCESCGLGKLIHAWSSRCVLQCWGVRCVSDGFGVCRSRSACGWCCFYIVRLQLGYCVIQHDKVLAWQLTQIAQLTEITLRSTEKTAAVGCFHKPLRSYRYTWTGWLWPKAQKATMFSWGWNDVPWRAVG